jgi:hypothetical protein
MIVNVMRRSGEGVVPERVDSDFFFEGGAAEAGVLATFELDGRDVTGRVVRVLDPGAGGPADAGSVVEVELIDETGHDLESDVTRANLPPPNAARIKR